jgi:hypothetical protein
MEITTLYTERQSGNISDKWSLYLREYDRLFAPYASRAVNLLEIGVQNGGSLEVWASYFSQGSKIVGCDINPLCGLLQFESEAVHLVVGDINRADTQCAIYAHTPAFDIVIDDGSHTSPDIIQTFCALFGRVNDGGLYVVEDLHCSYWQAFGGGLHHPHSAYAFFKALVDICNHEHWGVDTDPATYLFQLGFDVGDLALHLGHIHSVEFLNSLCVVRKRAPAQNVLGLRVVRGSVEAVHTNKYCDNTAAPLSDERNNPYSIAPTIVQSLSPQDLLSASAPAAQLASQGAHSALYWDGSGQVDFSEERTVQCPWQFGPDKQTLALTLPPTLGVVMALRFDMADRPAWWRVHAVWLSDQEGRLLWTWQLGTPLFARLSPDMLLLPAADESAGLDVLALGIDPHALLCIPIDVLNQDGPGFVFGATVTIQMAALALPILAEHVNAQSSITVQTQTTPAAPLSVAADLVGIVDQLRDSLKVRNETIRLQQQQLQQQKTRQEQMHIELVRAEAQLGLLKDVMLQSSVGDRL